MAFKRSEDFKFYLYISASKSRMLYEQLSSATNRKKSVEWNVKVPTVSIKRSTTTEEKVSQDEMVKRIVEELESRDQLGSLKKPKSFIRDIFPMRWGFYDDCRTRPEGEPALVYFGGFKDNLLVGLGGSSCHVVGHQGATSTWSRSSAPTLTRWLLSGLNTGKAPASARWCDVDDLESLREEESDVFGGMAVAQHYLRPPTQEVEFVAKTITVGEVIGMDTFIGSKKAKAILATPLYVAQAERFDDNKEWGLTERDWLLDDKHQPHVVWKRSKK